MPSLNRVQLIGYLGNKPTLRETANGQKVSTFSIAVGHRWRGKNGETVESTDWFTIDAWGRLAEICETYLDKGRLVYIEGRLHTDKYEHEGTTKYFTKVIARQLQILDKKPKEEEPILEEEEPELD